MSDKAQDDLDIQQDVNNLKRVWEDLKSQKKDSKAKKFNASMTAPSNIKQQKKQKQQKQKKSKVIISDQNMKATTKNVTRNPKPNSEKVIEIFTNPIKMSSDPLHPQGNKLVPQTCILPNPQPQALMTVESLKKELANKDQQLSLLRVSNSRANDRIKRLEQQLEGKQQRIWELQSRQKQLLHKLSSLNSKDFNFSYGKVQYENFRQDSNRLLKLLKKTAEYGRFAQLAIEDGGVRFLHNVNKQVKTGIDSDDVPKPLHFCTCNKAFIPQPALWVPQKVYDFGKNFIKQRQGEVTQAQLQLLLYELNKLWRQRQKKIINHVNALKANEVGKYKRQLRDISRQRPTTSNQKE